MTASARAPKLPASLDPGALNLYHRNPRIGNIDLIKDSLRTNGQYKPVVVNVGTHTGRPNEVLAGNHTTMGFRQLKAENPSDKRWAKISVYWVDVTDEQAARIVVVDNRASDVAENDEQALYDLLNEMNSLDGTGYEDKDLAELSELLGIFSGPSDSDGAEDHDPDARAGNAVIEMGKLPKVCQEIGLTVGVIRIKVPREVYQSWYETLRADVGFEEEAIKAAILSKLDITL